MPGTPPQFVVHVGAHKTASTHLQNSLAASAMDLSAAGIMFYGPRDFRWGKPTLQERFGIANRPQDKAPVAEPDVVGKLAQGAGRVVLSEENFAGTLLNRWAKVRRPLYPDLPRRLALLSKATGPLEVALAVRNPTAILNSAYSQTVLAERHIPLAKYIKKNHLQLVDWADLAARILAVPGVKSLTVWRHEDYAAVYPQICAALLGPSAPSVPPLPGRMHQGLTAAAVAAVLADPDLPVKDAADRFPPSPEHPPFDAFDASTHALSADYYTAQIAALAAMDGVTLLKTA